ncbi:hypothetical protein MBLNU230_g0326t1 [Neophaeotheca triangularis]
MDAKPQRPRALRDENAMPASFAPAANGKSIHKRNQSTPALSALLQAGAVKNQTQNATKKVLGDKTANTKLAQAAKDDSSIDKKATVDKINAQELAKSATTFSRPATRPLQSKSLSSQQVPTNVSAVANSVKPQAQQAAQEAPKKLAVKKSKVFKEADASEGANKATSSVLPIHPALRSQDVPSSQGQQSSDATTTEASHVETHKTENVPLRKEAPAQAAVPAQQQASLNNYEYLKYKCEQQERQLASQSQVQAQAQQAVPAPAQYEEEDEYYYDGDGYTTARSFNLRGDSTGAMTTVLAPRYTAAIHQELALAKDHVELTRVPEDKEDEEWDISMVAEYSEEIFSYMRDLEAKMSPNPTYMDMQTEIQWSMRSVLMDWVVQVHQRFNLLPETLFLTANYIDRFLSAKIVSLGKLQLVGATAIFVAAKYEEVNCPTIQEIIYMVDNGYSADELLKAERFMLSMLRYELGWPGPMSFLRRISKADDYDLETRTLAKYFLEVTIMDERFVGCTPSFLAAGAHCMARLMLRKGDWSQSHAFYSNYTYSQLRQLLATLYECLDTPQQHHLAIFDKYTDKRYKRASTFVATEMARGFALPDMTALDRPVLPPSWMVNVA